MNKYIKITIAILILIAITTTTLIILNTQEKPNIPYYTDEPETWISNTLDYEETDKKRAPFSIRQNHIII